MTKIIKTKERKTMAIQGSPSSKAKSSKEERRDFSRVREDLKHFNSCRTDDESSMNYP